MDFMLVLFRSEFLERIQVLKLYHEQLISQNTYIRYIYRVILNFLMEKYWQLKQQFLCLIDDIFTRFVS